MTLFINTALTALQFIEHLTSYSQTLLNPLKNPGDIVVRIQGWF